MLRKVHTDVGEVAEHGGQLWTLGAGLDCREEQGFRICRSCLPSTNIQSTGTSSNAKSHWVLGYQQV